jgi:outer membrane lipoprotein-sorting protein
MISGTHRVRRPDRRARLAACLALALLCTADARAAADDAAAEPQWGLEQLMIELGQVQQTRARFVERRYLKVLKSPLELSGTLAYDAPDRLVKRTLEPRAETLTVDGERLVIEAQGRTRTLRLQDYPVAWAFVESFRSTLKGDMAALGRFYRLALEGGPHHWQLSLTPRDPKMSALIESILIDGRKGRIGKIEIREAQGDRSVMTVVEDVQ